VTLADTSSRPGISFKSLAAAAGVVLGAYLVWGLRSLIVPVAVGSLLAYICRPVVARLERSRVPRGVAIALLLIAFGLAALVIVNRIRAVLPSDTGALELRIRALYTLNQRYLTMMGLDRSLTRGNRIYQLVHGDLDPLVDRVSQLLALTPEEHAQFVASRPRGAHDAPAGSDRLVEYDRANVETLERRARTTFAEPATRSAARPPAAPAPTSVAQTPFAALGDIFSTWIISPLVFLFLLRDTGEIKRGLLRAVPNRLFEPALTVLADLDHALGDYVRGLFLECCLLGLTVALLTVIGVPLRWTIAIGIFTGATNMVPYMGFAAALLSGLAYALLAEDIRPLLPMVSSENFAIWVIVAVVLAELLKNVVYEPVVLGGAVNLHPLVVVIGVLGGAILFGLVGMLLAIPTITVVKVLVSSTARQLKAYGLI